MAEKSIRGRWRVLPVILLSVQLAACASFQGYPEDPSDPATDLIAFQDYFKPEKIESYLAAQGDARRAIRDEVVYGRLAAYDIEFSKFRRAINSQSNFTNVSGNVAALGLSGAGAVAGGVTTKAILAAASTAVLGATGEVDKDLFYQKTMPALLAQMEANRAKILSDIKNQLTSPDSTYPLAAAIIDLNAYKEAGSVPGAISLVSQSAAKIESTAQ